MLVGPRGVTAGLVDHAIDGVGAHEFPRHDGLAAPCGVAVHLARIERRNAAVGQTRVWRAAVYQGLVDVQTLFVFGGVTGGRFGGIARRRRIAVAGRHGWAIERAVIGHVVI